MGWFRRILSTLGLGATLASSPSLANISQEEILGGTKRESILKEPQALNRFQFLLGLISENELDSLNYNVKTSLRSFKVHCLEFEKEKTQAKMNLCKRDIQNVIDAVSRIKSEYTILRIKFLEALQNKNGELDKASLEALKNDLERINNEYSGASNVFDLMLKIDIKKFLNQEKRLDEKMISEFENVSNIFLEITQKIRIVLLQIPIIQNLNNQSQK